MGRHDWYRNAEWDDAIEAAFDKRLYRSRDPRQYLRIQANILVPTRPEISLYLLEEYFAYPIESDASLAYHTQAQAFVALRKYDKAAEALKCAVELEREYAAVDLAHFDFPLLVATRKMKSHYAYAGEVLARSEAAARLPVHFFQWFAASALLQQAAKNRSEASRLGALALEAAGIKHSGFNRHPSIGLVSQRYLPLIDQMLRLSKPGRSPGRGQSKQDSSK